MLAFAGVDLEPKVWVTVDVDAEKGTVKFHRYYSGFLCMCCGMRRKELMRVGLSSMSARVFIVTRLVTA